MLRRMRIEEALLILGLAALAPVMPTQAAAGQAPAPQAAAAPATRPPLLFREEWKQPPYTGELNDETRMVTPAAVGNANVELKLYGPDARSIGVYEHEGRHDLWTGMTTSPVALTLRHKTSFVNLSGLARLRATVRSQALHSLHPVVRLADGTLLAGANPISTDGQFITTEVSFGNLRWFKLDPKTVTTTTEVVKPDLTKVDEVGFADLMPGGGHGTAGWINVSAVELYALAVPR